MDFRLRSDLVLGLLCTALIGCDQNIGNSSSYTPVAVHPADAALTCPQIVADISQQNARIKIASARAKQTGQTSLLSSTDTSTPELNANSGSSSLVPGAQQETPGQLEADRAGTDATARSNALVEIGRHKKCFQ